MRFYPPRMLKNVNKVKIYEFWSDCVAGLGLRMKSAPGFWLGALGLFLVGVVVGVVGIVGVVGVVVGVVGVGG